MYLPCLPRLSFRQWHRRLEMGSGMNAWITATGVDLDNIEYDEMFFWVLGCVGSFGSGFSFFSSSFLSFPTVEFRSRFRNFDSGGFRMGLGLSSL